MRKIIIIGLILIWASCVTNRRIIYKTMDIQVNQDKKLSSIVLDIEDFIDKRKDSPDNKILFINDEQCGYEGRQVCINTERYYLKESVAHQAAHMLVEHLNKRNSFKIVVQNKKNPAN